MDATNTADLARAAIARSTHRHITREAALREILKRVPLSRRLNGMTLAEVKAERQILIRCVLYHIPAFEPNKINGSFTGKVRNPRKRLAKMRKAMGNENASLQLSFASCRAKKSLHKK